MIISIKLIWPNLTSFLLLKKVIDSQDATLKINKILYQIKFLFLSFSSGILGFDESQHIQIRLQFKVVQVYQNSLLLSFPRAFIWKKDFKLPQYAERTQQARIIAKPAQPELSTAFGRERIPVPDISPTMKTAAVNMVSPFSGARGTS